MILATGQIGKTIHFFLDDANCFRVEAVDSFATLEVGVGVLCGTADEGGIRRQSAGTVFEN